MARALNQVVILGGGTAGWLTASTLAAEHGASLDITLVESPDIPIIGVGEGTWPSMRTTLQKIGISERVLLKSVTRPLSKALNSLVGGVRAKRTLIIIRSVFQRSTRA